MLVHGIDDNDNVIPLLLDASGNVIVSASQLTTTGAKIKVDSSGRITVAVDEPHYLNPVGVVSAVTNISLPAGISDQTIGTVSVGQRWRLDTFCVYYAGTVAGVNLYPFIFDGAVTYFLENILTVTNLKFTLFNPNVILESGWSLRCRIVGATLNDDFVGTAFFSRLK